MRLEEFTQRIVDNYIANVTKQLTEVHNAKQHKLQAIEFKELETTSFDKAKLPFTTCILLSNDKSTQGIKEGKK
ncbi:hypothetical protein RB195_000818 [Necator americanus]|uniref:Uncharacterized protein n=1 Tax=Necator americanus TaxID=51031 RepID=A0ABR1DBH0_NECAM